jgi:hypothetical protein
MRLYSIRSVLGILLLAVVGMQLLTPQIVGTSIEASVEIKPETLVMLILNLLSCVLKTPQTGLSRCVVLLLMVSLWLSLIV